MSDFWKALDAARTLARQEKADACVVYLGGTYHAKLLSKANPTDVVIEVADDNGRTNMFVRKA